MQVHIICYVEVTPVMRDSGELAILNQHATVGLVAGPAPQDAVVDGWCMRASYRFFRERTTQQYS